MESQPMTWAGIKKGTLRTWVVVSATWSTVMFFGTASRQAGPDSYPFWDQEWARFFPDALAPWLFGGLVLLIPWVIRGFRDRDGS